MANEFEWNRMPSPAEGERSVRNPEREPGTGDLGTKARSAAEKARTEARSFAESGRQDLAAQIGGFGQALRRAGERLRDEEQERTAHYSDMLADGVERVAHFLEEHDSDQLLHRVEGVARKNPLFFVGGALLAGVAIGRFLKASPGAGGGGVETGGSFDTESFDTERELDTERRFDGLREGTTGTESTPRVQGEGGPRFAPEPLAPEPTPLTEAGGFGSAGVIPPAEVKPIEVTTTKVRVEPLNEPSPVDRKEE